MSKNSTEKFIPIDIMAGIPLDKRAEVQAKWILGNDIEVALEDKGLAPADVSQDPATLATLNEIVNGDVVSLTLDQLERAAALVSEISDPKGDNVENNRRAGSLPNISSEG